MTKITQTRKITFTREETQNKEWLYTPHEEWYFDSPWDTFGQKRKKPIM